ncbi:hypothetical protein WR25_27145 isoform B [Diploscapter pachys]|uniref:Uncharacterized protein n=1 Tax=Diploscapter pachys TaxID=2018661 RepID=A0A2A2LWB4_9BILA|nr:hypothetical protein WR25_27145 isoform A [Diploscapter pachys]PAV90492.1 hypothetical protein WR25_27145 isoform B [Diploscapter pachys]
MMEHENDSPVSSFYGKMARNDLLETDKSSREEGKDNFARNETEPEEFHVVDPFDDPMLVTTAFIDIHLQDADGNSALMLAATDNRLLHVKGILMMAANTRKLFEVLEMRNNEGLTAWDIAVRANNQQSAMLISQFTKDYCSKNKIRGRPFSISSHGPGLSMRAMETNEKDITFDFDNSPQTRPAPDFGLNDNQTPNVYDTSKTSISISKGSVPLLRRLSRDRMPNNIRGHPMDNLKRSKSSHSRLISGPQRTASGDSLTSSNCVVNSPYSSNPPPLTHPPDSGLGMFSKIRDLFANKKVKNHL